MPSYLRDRRLVIRSRDRCRLFLLVSLRDCFLPFDSSPLLSSRILAHWKQISHSIILFTLFFIIQVRSCACNSMGSKRRPLLGHQLQRLIPDNIVDTNDVLLFCVFRITHNCSTSLNPSITAIFIHNAIVMC